jgi:hypothetical protein
MRKLHKPTLAAEPFADGFRITVRQPFGEALVLDITAAAAEALRAQLEPQTTAGESHGR